MNAYHSLLDFLAKGEAAVLVTVLPPAGEEAASRKVLFPEGRLNSPDPGAGDEDREYCELARAALVAGELQFVQEASGNAVLAEPYFPEPRLLILGGGHVARPLAAFAAPVGFRVTVVDDRPSFASKERFLTADRVLCLPFKDCLAKLAPDDYSYVVIVTRGHREDLDCLRQALRYHLAYLGMIGSRRRVKGVRDLLAAEGVAASALARLHSPIGLPIGAVTPEEIAVSILAQLIAVRRLGSASPHAGPSAPRRWPEFDRAVLEAAAQPGEGPYAMVTVLATKGSTPRSAGAKMLVWPDRRTLGSVGGGCTEAEVIQAARQLAVKGGHRLLQLDLTAEAADEEGTACGGTLTALIEAVGAPTV